MAEIEVRLTRRNGSEETIERPLHIVSGKPAITYKGHKWPIDAKGCLDLRKATPFSEAAVARPASRREAQNFSVAKPNPRTVSSTPSGFKSGVPATIPDMPPPRDPAEDEFDASQKDAITALASARLLVDAGPGTGKTAVACARVAWLAKTGNVPPSQIWLISFTRTAVQEIRSRLRRLIGDPMIARAVQVGTLDSIAWQINKGANSKLRLTEDFDDNIRALHGQLVGNESIRTYLSSLGHLIIDEAQDIVGARANLLLELINALSPSCGVTVFADEAQAIYGFSEIGQDEIYARNEPALSLPVRIRKANLEPAFTDCVLTQVHRTSDPKLLKIFTDVRTAVLTPASDSQGRNNQIRDAIKAHSHGSSPDEVETVFRSLPQDSFVLYRRRGDALIASSMLHSKGVPHRIRMSGLPATVPSWIAVVFSDVTDPRVDRIEFEKFWRDRVAALPLIAGNTSIDDAWRVLTDTASDKTGRFVDLRLLRDKIATRPPPNLVRSELGAGGPVVGTIHASKGREASVVHLMLPGEPDEDSNAAQVDEETRVLYVGATRARAQLFVGRGFTALTPRLPTTGRVYRFFWSGGRTMCSVEVGLSGDLKPKGLAGRQYFKDADAVRSAQSAWVLAAATQSPYSAFAKKFNDGWRMAVRDGNDGADLAVLENRVTEDLWELAKRGAEFFNQKGTPRSAGMLPYLRVMDLTTVAVRAGDPEAALLHDPWQKTGFLLAPVLYGFCPFNVRSV